MRLPLPTLVLAFTAACGPLPPADRRAEALAGRAVTLVPVEAFLAADFPDPARADGPTLARRAEALRQLARMISSRPVIPPAERARLEARATRLRAQAAAMQQHRGH